MKLQYSAQYFVNASRIFTVWKVSKYGVFFTGKYVAETTLYLDTFYAVIVSFL